MSVYACYIHKHLLLPTVELNLDEDVVSHVVYNLVYVTSKDAELIVAATKTSFYV